MGQLKSQVIEQAEQLVEKTYQPKQYHSIISSCAGYLNACRKSQYNDDLVLLFAARFGPMNNPGYRNFNLKVKPKQQDYTELMTVYSDFMNDSDATVYVSVKLSEGKHFYNIKSVQPDKVDFFIEANLLELHYMSIKLKDQKKQTVYQRSDKS